MRSRLLRSLIAALAVGGCTTTSRNQAGVVPPPLNGGEWHAITVEGRPAIPADITKRPSLRFIPDSNLVAGSTGCNRITGPYTTVGDSLTFGALAMTRMACLDSAVNDQENKFAAALNAIGHFAITADTLTLFSAGTPRLRFVR